MRGEEKQLDKYIQNSPEKIMKAVRTRIKYGSREIEEKDRFKTWSEKVMHGQFLRQTEDVRTEDSWLWLRRGTLKRETESLITAAQEQALRTNYRRAKIEQDGSSPLCRMCGERDETVSHIVSECSKLAQSEYKARHDRVATAVHWCLAKKHGLQHSDQWYQHIAEPVIENDRVKLLWDFNVYTDHLIHARRPDIVVVDKDTKECLVIDIAVPGDTRVKTKEDEKCDKYRELCKELGKLWKVKCTVIPVVIGALGTVPTRLTSFLGIMGINLSVETIQKSAILGSARILRKVLECKDQ